METTGFKRIVWTELKIPCELMYQLLHPNFRLEHLISKENAAVVSSWVDDNKEKLKTLFPVLDRVR